MFADISESMKIAIGLFIISAVIAVAFTIMQFSRTATSQGVTMVENSMNAMQLSKFDDYDQKNGLSGTQVRSAMKLFDGSDVAILVATMSGQNVNGTLPEGTRNYFNYGALVASGTNYDSVSVSRPSDKGVADKYRAPLVTVREGTRKESYYSMDLHLSTAGTKIFYNDRMWTEVAGKPEYIRTTAKFSSSLIKDNTGEIVGILFTQQR